MRILLDTNILVRAAISPRGLARRILDQIAADATHTLIISAYLLAEVADVLSRPRIQARCPLSQDEIQSYCDFIWAAGCQVRVESLPSAVSDIKDQPVIEAAVCGKADLICTSDNHFYIVPAKEYLSERGIAVLDDQALWAVLVA